MAASHKGASRWEPTLVPAFFRFQFKFKEVTMRRLVLVSLCLFTLSALAQAQESPPRVFAHTFFGGGGAFADGDAAGSLHFGGGGEGLIYKGLGAGAEIGYLFPRQSFGDGIGILSTNGLYRFGNDSGRKVTPFLTAGYSLGFRSGTANMVNFGGGVDYWVRERMGLRLEVRDHVSPGGPAPATHFLMFRVGLVGR